MKLSVNQQVTEHLKRIISKMTTIYYLSFPYFYFFLNP